MMSNMSTGINTQLKFDEQNVQNNYTPLAYFQYVSTKIIQAQATQNALISQLIGDTISTFHFASSFGVTGTNTVHHGFVNTDQIYEFSTYDWVRGCPVAQVDNNRVVLRQMAPDTPIC